MVSFFEEFSFIDIFLLPLLGIREGGDLIILGSVRDIFQATGKASFVVNVVIGKDIDATLFLDASLKKLIPLGDIDGIHRTINLVSSVVGEKNCSGAPHCTALNRDDCLVTSNTCSSCLPGYKGVIGDSNAKCVNESLSTGTIGSHCVDDDDCLYQHCDIGICTAPQQTCQTNVPGTVCSGYGTCMFLDFSGNAVKNCTLVNQFCSPSCLCDEHYGGVDCSIYGDEVMIRARLRAKMCSALSHIISVSQESPQLFDSIASTLLSAYDKDEIPTTGELVKCSSVVRFLGTLASRGFLKGTLPVTQQIYAEISSRFVGTRVSSNSTNSVTFANDVSNAVTGLVSGIKKGMVEGQNPISLITSNIRATVINQLVSSLSSTDFSPPPTVAELAYGSLQPKIVFPGDGISACSSGASYAQISTLQFGVNPHLNSGSIQSPLLQFSSTFTTRTPKGGNFRRGRLLTSHRNDTAPSYYIIIQFSSVQRLNVSVQAGSYNRSSNVTIPECAVYDATAAKYVSCGDCKISSYTNFNATFGCYNIKNLCPSTSKKSRQLVSDQYEYHRQGDVTSEEDNAADVEDDDEEDDDGSELSTSSRSRELDLYLESASGSTDDYNDGSTSSDDQLTSRKKASVSDFGTILVAVAGELASVLSLNPFAIDLNKAVPVLAFVGSLFGIIVIGLMYFLKWDKIERHDAVYLFDAKESEQKKKIIEDLTGGGNGMLSKKNSGSKIEKSVTLIDNSKVSIVKVPNKIEIIDGNSTMCPTADDMTVNTDKDVGNGVFGATILIAQFSNKVLPQTYTVDEKLLEHRRGRYRFNISLWAQTLDTIRRTHYLTAMFYRSSQNVSRTLQFIAACRKVLLALFIDTVMYGVFFPSDGTCTVFLKKSECILLPSKVCVFDI